MIGVGRIALDLLPQPAHGVKRRPAHHRRSVAPHLRVQLLHRHIPARPLRPDTTTTPLPSSSATAAPRRSAVPAGAQGPPCSSTAPTHRAPPSPVPPPSVAPQRACSTRRSQWIAWHRRPPIARPQNAETNAIPTVRSGVGAPRQIETPPPRQGHRPQPPKRHPHHPGRNAFGRVGQCADATRQLQPFCRTAYSSDHGAKRQGCRTKAMRSAREETGRRTIMVRRDGTVVRSSGDPRGRRAIIARTTGPPYEGAEIRGRTARPTSDGRSRSGVVARRR